MKIDRKMYFQKFSFDFLLNLPLAIFGLTPLYKRKSISFDYVSVVYTIFLLTVIFYGEYAHLCKVYLQFKAKNISGIFNLTYFAGDGVGFIIVVLDLIMTQLFRKLRFQTELKGIEIDDIIERKIIRLRKSVIFFVLFFFIWVSVLVWNLFQSTSLDVYQAFFMSIGVLSNFNVTNSIEIIFIRIYYINRKLEALLVKSKDRYKVYDIKTEKKGINEIHKLCDCYVQLAQISKETSANFGITMLGFLLHITLNLVSFSSWMLVTALGQTDTNNAPSRYAALALLYTALLYYFLYTGTQLIEESRRTQDIIWTNLYLGVDPYLVLDWELFATKTLDLTCNIDYGYFVVSLDLLGKMANSILTQIVIICTFQDPDGLP